MINGVDFLNAIKRNMEREIGTDTRETEFLFQKLNRTRHDQIKPHDQAHCVCI